MHPQRKQRLIVVLAIVVGVGLAAGLILLALKENLNAFYTPGDIAAGDVPFNRTIRVGGLVVKGSVDREPGELKVSFVLKDHRATVPVHYEGILPDLFREGQGIIAIGKLAKEQNGAVLIIAEQVLAKHDENYMSPELKAAMDAQRKQEEDALKAVQ